MHKINVINPKYVELVNSQQIRTIYKQIVKYYLKLTIEYNDKWELKPSSLNYMAIKQNLTQQLNFSKFLS